MLVQAETQNTHLLSGHRCLTCSMFQFPGKRWGKQLEDLYTQFFLANMCQNLKKNPHYNLKDLNFRRTYDSFDKSFVIYVYKFMEDKYGENQCIHDLDKHQIKTKSKHQSNTRRKKRYEEKYKQNIDISYMIYLKAQQIYSEGRGTSNLNNLIMDYQKRIAEQKLFEVVCFSNKQCPEKKSLKKVLHSMQTRSKILNLTPKNKLIEKDSKLRRQ